MMRRVKEKLKDPLFLMFEALAGLWILETDLPPAVFGWKGIGLLMIAHSAFTMLYIFLYDLQRKRVMEKEET